MLVDEVTITIKGGHGGRGAVHFKRNAQTPKGGPDGGNGGNGGSIYVQGLDDITGLKEFQYKKHIEAENGIHGGRQNLFGRNGKDTTVSLPIGTFVTDIETHEQWEIKNRTEKILVAKGGKGGRGNNAFKSATDQAPFYAEHGTVGQKRTLRLELKIIADIGFIGLPNAGKSSLLQAVTNAKPKIGNYPFTTLEPNVGVLDHIMLADIPGLIEGAHNGKGLGIKFLRHIEKTKILIHCIDSASETLIKDYQTVRHELETYNEALIAKREIILLTKTDLVNEQTLLDKIREIKKIGKQIMTISVYDQEAISSFKDMIKKITKSYANS
jgi:GTP-binding protein